MKKFTTDREGNIAVAFALAIIPILGAAGMAVDYSRAVNASDFIQSQADAAALSAVKVGQTGDARPYVEYLRVATAQKFGGGQWVEDLVIDGEWITPTDYRVTVEGALPVTILGAVPGFPNDVPFDVAATVRISEPTYVYTAPTVTDLDYEAGDYNRLYVYCYNPAEDVGYDEDDDDRDNGYGNDPGWHDDDDDNNNGNGGRLDRNGRSEMIAISDNNRDSKPYEYEMPRCGPGEMMSYKLRNVRMANGDRSKWDNKHAEHYEYHTDTVLDATGAEQYDLGGWDILETVLCDSLEECKPKSQGGIIPEGKNRKPQKAEGACEPGKYMYYGWEDRPPGRKGPAKDWTDVAWTDKDYDDIRVVIGCPEIEEVGDRVVRLLR